MMRLIQALMTQNPCYTAGRTITVKGLMLHSVGCAQPSASVFINNWNRASYKNACVHGFIDGNDGTVYQTLPWNHRGWHAGGSANNTHIGTEMCEPGCIKYTGGATFTCSDTTTARAVVKLTYEAAVELFAMLCKEYGLDPMADGVIISHKEGCARGVASNHGDPEHLWSQLGTGYTMNTFRAAVKAALSEEDENMTQAQFDKMMADWQARNNPVYKAMTDVPDYWKAEAQAFKDAGAIKGDGVNELGVARETLKAAVICKRYVDAVSSLK